MTRPLSEEVINIIVYSEYSPALSDYYEGFRKILTAPEMVTLGNYIANDLIRELKYHKIPIDYFDNPDQRFNLILWLYGMGKTDKITTTEEIRKILVMFTIC